MTRRWTTLQFPHELVVITPAEVTDAYDNPTPQLEYGDKAARRRIRGLLHPGTSAEPATLARQPVVTSWRLFTAAPISARERVEWRGQVFEVDGEPSCWSPRFGHTHYETQLVHVDG
ncbi:hypothetical protein [Amycolatopsis sp. NPDC059657]|uniref:hypothetical protein n=1 Tax=Amycolatopsis sp. NPDC059657 TaxID=3346899 RepID=UPI00366C5A19